MATWPASLPQRLRLDGFSSQIGSGAIRTEMDAGPAFQRRRFTASVAPISGTIVVDVTQLTTLMDFYKTTLGQGALEFDWSNPLTELPASMRFVVGQEPSISPLGAGRFVVSLTLEVLP